MRAALFLTLFIVITVWASTVSTDAQTDSTKRFFPSAVGNKWHWLDEIGGSTFYREITRDSVAGNRFLFLFFDGRSDPSFKIDTVNNLVYQFPGANDPPVLWYNLSSQHGDSFYTWNGMYKVKVHVYPTNVFGRQTTAKEYRWYVAASNYWYSTHVLGQDFGPLRFWADWAPPASTRVIGCIIDSVKYGTLASTETGHWALPSQFGLQQNYPNPFNPTTTISFAIPKRSHLQLKVLDMLGREVVTLLDNEMPPGSHSVTFDAHGLASGVYLYKLQAGQMIQIRKMVLVK